MNSGSLRTRWPDHATRKPTSRNRTIMFLASGETITKGRGAAGQQARFAKGRAMLEGEKARLKAEQEEKERLAKAVAEKRKLQLPATLPIKKDKEGNFYVQPRNEKGHMMAKKVLA